MAAKKRKRPIKRTAKKPKVKVANLLLDDVIRTPDGCIAYLYSAIGSQLMQPDPDYLRYVFHKVAAIHPSLPFFDAFVSATQWPKARRPARKKNKADNVG